MDENEPYTIDTIRENYNQILSGKIETITDSVKALIANYQAQLSEIERLQKSKSGESDESDESDESGEIGESGEPQNCSTVEAEFNEYKKNVNAKIAELLAEMKTDASKLEELNKAVGTAVESSVRPVAGGRKHKRSKKRSKHNKRRTTHKKQSRRRRRH